MLLLASCVARAESPGMSGADKLYWSALIARATAAIAEQKHDKLLDLAEQAYAFADKKLPPKHASLQTSAKLLWAALTMQVVNANHRGDYSQALDFAQRSYTLSQRHFPSLHPLTLTSLNNLSSLEGVLGHYPQAEKLYKSVISLSEEMQQHDDYKDNFNPLFAYLNLASLYANQGHFGQAEAILDKAYRLSQERRISRLERWQLLNQRGNLYRHQKRTAAAKEAYQAALRIATALMSADYRPQDETEKNAQMLLARTTQASGYFQAIETYRGLAAVASDEGKQAQTDKWLAQALALSRDKLGQEHAYSLRLAAEVASRGLESNLPESIATLQSLLPKIAQAFGREHPWTLGISRTLATAYYQNGDYAQAKISYEKTLQGQLNYLGHFHPDTLQTQLKLAQLYMALEEDENFLRLVKQMETGWRFHARDQFFTTPKSATRRNLFNRLALAYQSLLFSAVAARPNNLALREFAAQALLNWRQQQAEQEALIWQAVQQPRYAGIVQKRQKASSELARLFAQSGENSDFWAEAAKADALTLELAQANHYYQHYRAELARYKARLADLDAQLPDEARPSDELTLTDVRQRLKPGEVLLALRSYRPMNFANGKFLAAEPAAWLVLWLDRRQSGWTHVASAQKLARAWSGLSEALSCWEQVWAATRNAAKLAACNADADDFAMQLYQQLFAQVDDVLAAATKVYLIADGFLTQAPFARLRLPDGRYWIQRQTLAQLQHARDLPSRAESLSAPRSLLAVGGIDFGESTPLRGGLPESFETLGSLEHSWSEIKVIGELAGQRQWQVTLLTATEATEAALRQAIAQKPQVLHLATHAFFLSQAQTDYPLLRAGIALAGADYASKKRDANGDDGILYAQEILNLDLSPSHLVVLSACDTGKGVMDYAEGVYGLVRAFRVAGARSLIMTLWQLNDSHARDFMVEFYRQWLNTPGASPADALRQTQLVFLNGKPLGDQSLLSHQQDPGIWAAYVAIGD